MMQFKTREKEFEEKREFNPVFWNLRKKLFALRRYRFNYLLLLLGAGGYYLLSQYSQLPPLIAKVYITLFVMLIFCLRIAFEWERVPILRIGNYSRVKGPGLFFMIPVMDTIIDYIDSRIRVTDFTAEKILTKDSVPVYVDAIIFWMVWDAKKAVLEVENYRFAVSLSAKTALRDIIGKNSLSKLLTDRDGIGHQLQKILDAKTNPWGITSQSVEIKDIVIPRSLEKAMSKEAQAERAKNARLILGEAEVEVAEKYAEASRKYEKNDTALQLRSLNLLMESMKKNNSMILLPSDTTNLFNLASASAVARQAKKKGKRDKGKGGQE